MMCVQIVYSFYLTYVKLEIMEFDLINWSNRSFYSVKSKKKWLIEAGHGGQRASEEKN